MIMYPKNLFVAHQQALAQLWVRYGLSVFPVGDLLFLLFKMSIQQTFCSYFKGKVYKLIFLSHNKKGFMIFGLATKKDVPLPGNTERPYLTQCCTTLALGYKKIFWKCYHVV